RGIMRLLESRDIHRNVYLTERICGICNVAHTTAYCTTVELLLGIDLPERARYIRTLMGELERIHSHLLWLGVAGDLIGFKTLFMLAWREREEIMDIFELISGSRRAPAMNIIGGVRLDIQEAVAAKITERLEALRGKVGRLVDIVYDHPVARSRLEDVGVLRIDTAKEAGALGPTARASNWKVDVRWSDPYAAYGDEYTTWDVVTETGGDSWARTVVRLRELIVSVDICLQALKALAGTSGPFKTEAGELNPGEALGKTEAPRGELLYYIVSDGTNIPHTVRIRTPSYRNNSVIPSLLRGSALADAPVIVGSIDPCYSCTDRMVIVEDAKTGRVETGRLRDLAQKRT
ncbi:MAG: nickel-dependent hydrogenase large subunit, partial [Candidatus Bathyarchaeia archaeon]